MHGELHISDSIIMFTVTTNEFLPRPAAIFIYVESVEDIYKKAITLGAKSTLEPMQQPYGFTCGFTDVFGNEWWPAEGV